MMLTPRAEALLVPLRSGLSALDRALDQPAVIEPASSRRVFRLASPDLFDLLAVPRLLERVQAQAPGVDLVVAPLVERGLLERLETGELDVAIVPRVDPPRGGEAEPAPAGLMQRRLLRRRVALRIPHFYSALAIVAQSDLVVTAPNALGHWGATGVDVVALECPLPLPKHSVNLVWHERFSKDTGHAWLREVIIALATSIQRDIE